MISTYKWKKITRNQLDVDYGFILSQKEALMFMEQLEKEINYFENDLARVKVFGKWHPIPRKQASFGDPGLSYKFSGNIVPALAWTPTLLDLKHKVEAATGNSYNFVLVNRYKDGNDYMGEHKDDEKELVKTCPIASLSLGASRDFIFRHESSKRGNKTEPNVKIVLQSGSLLLMNSPTNQHWYHSLPKRKSCRDVRINLTFRKMQIVR